jgi:hypothetical protein
MTLMGRGLPAVLIAVSFLAAPLARSVAAQTGQQQSRPFTPGTCGRVDPSYLSIAEATGGQPMFLQPSEMAAAGHLMRETTSSSSDALLYATAHLGGQARDDAIPIDSAVKRLTFSLSFDAPGTTMTLLRPSGATVTSGEGGVEVSEWTCGRIITIGSPEEGTWRVRLSGTGRFWLRVTAQGDLYILSAEFVQLGGRPGHEGYFKIPGQPLAGRPQKLHATVSGALQSAEFKLVSADGKEIQSVEMKEEGADPEDHEYFGTLTLPVQPFRVAVSGRDGNGLPFQRLYLTQFRGTTIEIAPSNNFDELSAGATTTLTFGARNYGEAGSFRFLAVDSRGAIIPTQPAEVALASGASAQVRLDVTVPSGTAPGTGVTVTITATDTAHSEITNGSVVELSVSGP